MWKIALSERVSLNELYFFRAGEDEDTFWLEFSERDFQSVYETAHQVRQIKWGEVMDLVRGGCYLAVKSGKARGKMFPNFPPKP